jgi:hypothetical protein
MRAVTASRKSTMAVTACECTGSFDVVHSVRGMMHRRVSAAVLLTLLLLRFNRHDAACCVNQQGFRYITGAVREVGFAYFVSFCSNNRAVRERAASTTAVSDDIRVL